MGDAGDTGVASEPDDQPKGVTVVVHKSEDSDFKLPMGVKTVSILYFVYGGLAIIIGIIRASNRQGTGIYDGFVAAVLYFTSGSIGFLALKKPTSCNSSAFLVMSIVSGLWSLVALTLGSMNVFGVMTAVLEILWAVAAEITCVIACALSCRGLCCSRSSVNMGRLKEKALIIISGAQILVGLIFTICFPLNVIIVGTFSIFEEIWCGIIFIIIGIFGVFTARRASVSWLTAFVTLSVFGSLFCIVILVTTAIKTAYNDDPRYYETQRLESDLSWMRDDSAYNCTERQLPWDFNRTIMELPVNFTLNVEACELDRATAIKEDEIQLAAILATGSQENTNLFILVLQLALVLVEIGITVASIVLACQPLCGPSVDSTAYYIPQQQLQSGVVHVTKGSDNTQDRFGDEESGKQYSRLE